MILERKMSDEKDETNDGADAHESRRGVRLGRTRY